MPHDPPAPQATVVPEIPAPTCEPPVNTAKPIEGRVVFLQGQPMPASKAPVLTESYEPKEVINLVHEEGKAMCLEPKKLGYQMSQHISRTGGLWCMVMDARWDAPRIARPNNHETVVVAGRAVLDAYYHVPKGQVMDIDPDKLRGRLDRLTFLQGCRRSLFTIVSVLDNNIAAEEVAIDSEVRIGLKDVSGLLDDRRLEETLAPALLHVRGPAEQAVITRAMMKKAFEAGRLQGQAEAAAKAAATPTPPPALPSTGR